jgi:hypothetical protein
MKKVLGLALFLILLAFSLFKYLTAIQKGPLPKITQDEPAAHSKSHVGCSDIREVVEENGRYYIACIGGVLVLDKNSGQVLNQITMSKGLSDFVTTGLIKKGNTLYIGTQDGLTIWDLYTNTGKKLSVGEGLPNGANILLKEDGKYIWIGTFDGLARLDTENGRLETFREELSPYEGEKLSVPSMATTKDYVYFSIVASEYSSGFVARYNKVSSMWEKFDTSAFGDAGQYARIDAFGLCNVSDGIFLVEGKTLWKISDEEGAKPLRIFTASFNDGIEWNILCSKDSVLFNTYKNKLVYTDGKVRPFDSEADKKLLEEYETRKNKTDFKRVFGENNSGTFYQMLGVINDNVYLTTYTGLWVYSINLDKLTPITLPDKSTLDSMGNSIFWPIEGSNRYVVFEQTCGMGCETPMFYVCNYPNNQCQTLKLSPEVEEIIGPPETGVGEGFGYYGLSDYEKGKDDLKFKVSDVQNNPINITLRAGDLQWVVEKVKDTDTTGEVVSQPCTNESTYKFVGNTLSADKVYCVGKEFSILVDNYYYKFDQDLAAVRLNKDTGTQDILFPKMTESDYTPFNEPGWGKPNLNRLVSYEGKVYFATSRGLWILDTSKNALDSNSWDLVSIKNGLLSNEVRNFVYVGNKLFVLTPAGITAISD